MILDLEVTPVFQQNWEAYNASEVKTIINQGGSRLK